MSIAGEITRINGAKLDMKSAIEEKEVSVPSSALISDYSLLVDSIETGGGELEPFTFDYDNWIAYGASEPDATEYRYWINAPTTPSQAPLKMSRIYQKRDSYTGEIDSIVSSGTFTFGDAKNDGAIYGGGITTDGVYYITGINASIQNVLGASADVYIFDIRNVANPSHYIKFTDNAFKKISVSSVCKNMGSNSYGGCIYNNGKIYFIFDIDSVSVYDIETDTFSKIMGTPLTSSNRIVGGAANPNDANSLYIFTIPSGASNITSISVINYNILTGTSSAVLTHAISSRSAFGFTAKFFDTNQRYINFMSQQTLSSSESVVTIDLNDVSSKREHSHSGTKTTYYWLHIVCGINEVWAINRDDFDAYRLNSATGQFEKIDYSSYGNLFMAVIYSGYWNAFTISQDWQTFTANVSSFQTTLSLDGDKATQYYLMVPGDYDGVQFSCSTSRNISWGHSIRENIDSSTSIIIPCKYRPFFGSSYDAAALRFYPKTTKKFSIISLMNSGILYAIYNQTNYQIKTAVNGSWANYDPEDYCALSSY